MNRNNGIQKTTQPGITKFEEPFKCQTLIIIRLVAKANSSSKFYNTALFLFNKNMNILIIIDF